jgi:hypothetical protein
MSINGYLACSLIVFLVSSTILYGVPSSEFGFFNNNNSFAQRSDTQINNSASGAGATTTAAAAALQLNTYENNELGLSLKYPSTFLIDESNLTNQTLKQVSFFPVDEVGGYPEKYIQWMDVFVQTLNGSQYALSPSPAPTGQSNNTNIGTLMVNLANDIQQQNEDVTILSASTDALLSGQPAYKLITRSYSENSTIDEVQVGTIVDNTLYSLNFEVESANYTRSLPVIDAITESFKIKTASTIVEEILDLSPSNANATTAATTSPSPASNTGAFPLLLDRVLSSLKSDLRVDEITNNSRELKNLENSINNLLADSRNGGNQSQGDVNSVEKGFRDLLSSLNLSDNATQRLDTSEFNNLIGSVRSFTNSTGLSDSPAVISSLLSNLLSSPSSPLPSSPMSGSAENATNNNNNRNLGDYLNFNRTETESVVKQYLNNGTKDVLRMFDFLTSR